MRSHKRNLGDRLFAPGLIYLMSGEPYEDAEPIYKIGATTQDPRARAKQIEDDMHFMSVRVLHSFPVDNMRVVESLLHSDFSRYRLDWIYTREWFDIDHEAYELTQCAGIYVNDALAQLSGHRNVRKWWLGLKGDALISTRRQIARHPLVRIELERWVCSHSPPTTPRR